MFRDTYKVLKLLLKREGNAGMHVAGGEMGQGRAGISETRVVLGGRGMGVLLLRFITYIYIR